MNEFRTHLIRIIRLVNLHKNFYFREISIFSTLSFRLIYQECLNTGHNLISDPQNKYTDLFQFVCVTDVHFRKTDGHKKQRNNNKKYKHGELQIRNPQILMAIIILPESPTSFWPSDRKFFQTVYFSMNFEVRKSCP